ncbi:MAG TPA: cell envelope integrity protein CreD [Candidatus Competibacteraceae bacterium]|nr:cell envelope integrity protein CreD [Candidatus Competibacteraceae bacterium]
MKYGLFAKIALIFLVTLVLAAGLAQVSFLVSERMLRRDGVVAEIAASTARDQVLAGPVLVIPYTRIIKTLKPVDSNEEKMIEVEKRSSDRVLLLPAELDIQTRLNTEPVRRGLYQAVVFGASLAFKGRFAAEGAPIQPGTNEQIIYGEPRLMVGISDPRGILRAPALHWAEQRLDFMPGTGEERMANGIQARLQGLDLQQPWAADFTFSLDLRGTQSLSVAPAGDATRITMRSGWPHPSFFGQFLPEAREITPEGFTATWATTRLAANMDHYLNAYLRGNQGLNGLIGVRFIEPADSYVQSDRALKYALLFIGLSFTAFFLFEVLKRLAIHPLQYGLTGAALVLFYLLLLSLSEHIGFASAYAIATAACVALVSYYLVYVLGGIGWGLGFGVLLGGVFGILYVLISLEDYALLAGSLTLFGFLALAMVLTRKVDWYQLSDGLPGRRGQGASGASAPPARG